MAKILETRIALSHVGVTHVETGLVRQVAKFGQGGHGDFMSLARHLSSSDPDTNPVSRPERAYPGAASAAIRAGRSGCSAGVLVRAGLARIAGRTIPSGGSPLGMPSCSGLRFGGTNSPLCQRPQQQGLAMRPTANSDASMRLVSLGSWPTVSSKRGN